MSGPRPKLILWTGPKHSGKTTAAEALVAAARSAGLAVAGLLAPSRYEGDRLVGFDAVDVRTGARAGLARSAEGAKATVGSLRFLAEGESLGRRALGEEAVKDADLVVVDEFGPLELRGGGWRKQVDRLVASGRAAVLLVVRQALVETVRELYAGSPSVVVPAQGPDAAQVVLRSLRMEGRS